MMSGMCTMTRVLVTPVCAGMCDFASRIEKKTVGA